MKRNKLLKITSFALFFALIGFSNSVSAIEKQVKDDEVVKPKKVIVDRTGKGTTDINLVVPFMAQNTNQGYELLFIGHYIR